MPGPKTCLTVKVQVKTVKKLSGIGASGMFPSVYPCGPYLVLAVRIGEVTCRGLWIACSRLPKKNRNAVGDFMTLSPTSKFRHSSKNITRAILATINIGIVVTATLDDIDCLGIDSYEKSATFIIRYLKKNLPIAAPRAANAVKTASLSILLDWKLGDSDRTRFVIYYTV